MSKENSLDNLEFFNSFSVDDPIDLEGEGTKVDDLSKFAPDILGADDEEEEEDLETPPNPPAKNPPATPPAPNDTELEDEEEDPLDIDEDDDTINYFQTFGKGLAKAGMLEFEEGEDPETFEWTEESFLSKMETTIEKKAWDSLESLALETYGDDGVKLIEDIFIKKVPVQEYLKMFSNEQVVENVDLSNEEVQEKVYRLYLSKTGLDDEEIQEQINYARDNERLETYAKKYHGKLLEKMQQERETLSQQSEARVLEMQRKEQERQEAYAEVLEGAILSGTIEGYPINKKNAEELYQFVLDKPVQLPNGQRISEFEYKLAKMRQEDPSKFLAIARLVQNNLDLTPVKKKAVSEETNSLFNDLKSKAKKPAKARSNTNDFTKFFS